MAEVFCFTAIRVVHQETLELGLSEAQLRGFTTEWKDAVSVRRAGMNLVQALTFATMPSLPPNKWSSLTTA